METKITVVIEDEMLFEAMYVDGIRVQTAYMILVGDIEMAANSRPVILSTMAIELPEGKNFPLTLEECNQFLS